jgi:NADH-quinone oxidoreductase subunit N
VAAYYYLRILVVMYMHEPGESTNSLPPVDLALKVAVYGSALATILLGIAPSWVLDYATSAALK